jgi:hypothetical protein
MSVGVMAVGAMSVGEITVGVMRRSRQKVRVILAKSTSFKIFRAVRK